MSRAKLRIVSRNTRSRPLRKRNGTVLGEMRSVGRAIDIAIDC